jgi:hypothetical protein
MCAPDLPITVHSESRAIELVASSIEEKNGTGPTVDLGPDHARVLVISMGINHVLEDEKLAISIWGSADGDDWGDEPLLSFPPKYYCGVYSTFLDLSRHPNVRYLRVTWNMARWGKRAEQPLFGFYVSAEECGTRACVGAG